jgi:hypothetical protein
MYRRASAEHPHGCVGPAMATILDAAMSKMIA